MKKNIVNNKNQTSLIIKVAICFAFLLTIFLAIQGKTTSFAVMAASEGKLYLSDMEYMEGSKAASGHLIKTDKNDSDKMIELKLNDNESRVFVKGVSAWASSEIVYDLTNYSYDYFMAYLGVDISEQSDYFNTGVKFSIYTSQNNKDWELKHESKAMYGWSNAEQINIPITGAKYLKLVANNNSPNWWAEWYDEAVYADAKLVKEGYKEEEDNKKVEFIKTVEEYDEIIKEHVAKGDEIKGDFELALLQREFVNNVGYQILQDFVKCDDDYKTTVEWLMSSLENMQLYIYGGEPDGNYISSLQALTKLYTTHKADLDIKETTSNNTVKGDLYKRMMITLSLTHSAQVALWMDTTSPENQSDPVTRYEIYKKLLDNNAFVISRNADGTIKYDYTPMFESLKVEEMRYVLNNIIDDEEIEWLHDYTQYYIDENSSKNKEEEYLQPHHYMKYIWPDYAREEFHDPNLKTKWDEQYKNPFTKYNITYRPGVYKLWMNIEGGAVCGGISKIGSNIRGVHGAPSSVISQPGHAALIYYRKNADGNGYWTIDNDVSGWAQSGKTEKLSVRMPLGWGSDEYVEGWAATYIVLAQEALNHYDNYIDSMKNVYLANTYKNDSAKQEELYRNAIKIQNYNIDAWYGLIKLYEADSSKKDVDYYNLATELGENLKAFPLPMYNLTNVIGKHMESNEYKFKFTMLQTNLLTEGSELPNERTDLVLQPAITRTVAKYLLGEMDTELAKFSFDGEDAGKIVLSDRFDNVGIQWDYILTGKSKDAKDWTTVTFNADSEHKWQLDDEEIKSITAENDIYVHIVGTSYDDANLYKIDITEQKNPEVYVNDLENRIIGVSLNTEWKLKDDNEWTSYEKTSPDLTGDKTIQIRQPATGTTLTSETREYTFTADNQDEKRRYVPVSNLSIYKVSTEEPGHQGSATNTIDGNINTRWHSNWSGQDNEKYIIIKTDEPIYLSAVEFVPAGGGNGRLLAATVYGSMDGEEWTELVKDENLTYEGTNYNDIAFAENPNNTKKFEIADSQEVQYIKIVGDRTSSAGGGSFMAARMFNIYEDVAKNPHITAGVAFTTTKPTNGNVEARLVNPSVEIEVTNNDGKETFEFTDNGKFTFEFTDKATHTKKGTAEATVDWIDREAPTATIEYSTTDPTYGEVLARLVPSEEVTVTNNPSNQNNEQGKAYVFNRDGKFTYEFEDAAGNKGTATAEVTWIRSTTNPDQNNPNMPEGPGIEDPQPDDDNPQPEDPSKPGDEDKPQQDDPTTPDEDEPQQDDPTTPDEDEPQTGDPSTPGDDEQQGDPNTPDNDSPQSGDPSTPDDDNPQSGDTTTPSEPKPNYTIPSNPSQNDTTTNGLKTDDITLKIPNSNEKTELKTMDEDISTTGVLPKTGLTSKVLVIISIGILSICSAVFYIKQKE